MNNVSLKQKAILATLGVVVLYAIAAGCWFLNPGKKRAWCPRSWEQAMNTYERAVKTYNEETRLIGQRQQWIDSYESEKKAMPLFESGKDTSTTWLAKVDEIAKKNHITISKRQSGKEIQAGDVWELEIDVSPWEGALESLVRFMHELENTDEGMFDMKSLSMKPSRGGYLKGSFTLTCAYMRE